MKKRIISIVLLSLIIILLGVILGARRESDGEAPSKVSDTVSVVGKAHTARIADRIFNLIILDESGSMSGLEDVSVSGVNETLQTIRDAYKEFPQQEQLVTFATFSGTPSILNDNSYCRVKRHLQEINDVADFTVREYCPTDSTPLWDTMGLLLCELEEHVTVDDIVLVTIITDGLENTSCKYDSEKIRSLVNMLDEMGWTFTYIGANQDAALVARDMGIKNSYQYSSDVEGIRNMYKRERRARTRFYRNARLETLQNRLQEGYFDEDDKE